MASRSTNTMSEGLQRILGDISQLKTVGDADLTYLTELETMVIGKLREPIDAVKQNATGMPPAMAGPSDMGMPPGSGQGGGLMSGAQPPAPDDLQRLLGSGSSMQ